MTDDARKVLELAKGLPREDLASLAEALALELPRDQRASVAAALCESLADDRAQAADVSAAWAAELRRRLQSLRAGAQLGSWDETVERARKRLEDRRRLRHG